MSKVICHNGFNNILDNLYMGGAPAFFREEDVEDVPGAKRFDCVFLCAQEYQVPSGDPEDTMLFQVGFDDKHDLDIREMQTILAASDLAKRQIEKGRTTLISCWMGWNRSGIVTAITLLKLFPTMSPRYAVELIQKNRKDALRNTFFKNLILSYRNHFLAKDHLSMKTLVVDPENFVPADWSPEDLLKIGEDPETDPEVLAKLAMHMTEGKDGERFAPSAEAALMNPSFPIHLFCHHVTSLNSFPICDNPIFLLYWSDLARPFSESVMEGALNCFERMVQHTWRQGLDAMLRREWLLDFAEEAWAVASTNPEHFYFYTETIQDVLKALLPVAPEGYRGFFTAYRRLIVDMAQRNRVKVSPGYIHSTVDLWEQMREVVIETQEKRGAPKGFMKDTTGVVEEFMSQFRELYPGPRQLLRNSMGR